MDGYLASPEETRAVLADGWFRTGDLATVSPDGYVTVEGRKRERILRGGYSVFPGEVEAVLLAHPAVAEAAVMGEPHPELGEEVVAFVALREGTDEAPENLVAWCKEHLAGFKYPRTSRSSIACPGARPARSSSRGCFPGAIHDRRARDRRIPQPPGGGRHQSLPDGLRHRGGAGARDLARRRLGQRRRHRAGHRPGLRLRLLADDDAAAPGRARVRAGHAAGRWPPTRCRSRSWRSWTTRSCSSFPGQ